MAATWNDPSILGKVLKSSVVNIVLAVTSLVWYLCFFTFLKNNSGFVDDKLVILIAINLIATGLAAFIGVKVLQKFENRLKFMIYWMFTGVFFSLLLLLLVSSFFGFSLAANVIGPMPIDFVPPVFSFLEASLVSGVIGLYCGFGFPAVMGYFAATTKSVHRAKLSGIIIFLTSISYISIILFVQSALSAVMILIICKLCGLLAVIFLKPSEVKINKEEPVSYKDILKSRLILLYFIPWLMFSIVNSFAFPALNAGFDSAVVEYATLAENFIAGVFAVFFGFAADRFGRKRLLLFGFTMLGLGYAMIGLFSQYMRGLFFYTVADGMAWGIFTTLFILTIWGDIADGKDGEKFFVIGISPFLFSTILQVIFGHFITNAVTDLTRVFFFISIFLFLAITPLYLAPESLSEKDKRENELKNYLVKARKKAEKEANKKQHKKQSASLTDDGSERRSKV
jgi:MFS family permease